MAQESSSTFRTDWAFPSEVKQALGADSYEVIDTQLAYSTGRTKYERPRAAADYDQGCDGADRQKLLQKILRLPRRRTTASALRAPQGIKFPRFLARPYTVSCSTQHTHAYLEHPSFRRRDHASAPHRPCRRPCPRASALARAGQRRRASRSPAGCRARAGLRARTRG